MIRLIDEFLSPLELKSVHEEIEKRGYTYGWKSATTEEHRHWNCSWGGERQNPEIGDYDEPIDVYELPEIFQTIWGRLNKRMGYKHQLVRLYSNAYTYGTEGAIHYDSVVAENITHLIYITPAWDPRWAGETVFLDSNDEIYRAVLPKAGRLVEFAGNIAHAARSVTKFCPKLRQIIVFKSIPIKEQE